MSKLAVCAGPLTLPLSQRERGADGEALTLALSQRENVDDCVSFARALAASLVRDDPSRFTTANPKAGRESRILVDVLRNNRTNTAVAAYSLRARAGAPVSIPVAWDELDAALLPGSFTLASVRDPGRARDVWSDYWTTRQRLPRPPRKS